MLWGDRAEGVTAVEVAAGSPAARAGIQRGDVLLAVNGAPVETPRRRRRIPAPRHDGHAPVVHAGAARHAAGAGRVARAGAARQLDVLRAGRRRPVHAAGRRVGSAAAARAIRRRCISSGCASRSSARSRSRSTARSIGSTGSSTGATPWRWRSLPPLLLHFTLVFPERPRGGRRGPNSSGSAAARCTCRRSSLGVARDRRRDARRGRRRRCSRARSTCSTAPSTLYLFLCAVGGARRAGPRVRRDHVADRRGGSFAGSPGARCSASGRSPFGYALPWALGVEPAARAAADGDSARPRAADLRVGHRALPAARRRGHHQARPRLHGLSGGERACCTSRCCGSTGFVFANDADQHNWVVALLATLVVVLLAQPVQGRRAERARPRVLSRSLRLPPRARRRSPAT